MGQTAGQTFTASAAFSQVAASIAYAKMRTVLERDSLPDRLCGGAPLYLGEQPENEISAGAVGVDIPFPESGVAPASFL